MRSIGLAVLVLALAGCEKQAQQVLDKNPKYAGKADVHTAATGKTMPKAEVLRQRALLVQTDR